MPTSKRTSRMCFLPTIPDDQTDRHLNDQTLSDRLNHLAMKRISDVTLVTRPARLMDTFLITRVTKEDTRIFMARVHFRRERTRQL